METKKRPGPKPKPVSKKARARHFSFPPNQADFLDGLQEPSAFVQELIAKSPEYKKHLKKISK